MSHLFNSSDFYQQIPNARCADVGKLKHLLRKIQQRHKQHKAIDRDLDRFQTQLQSSIQTCELRRDNSPTIRLNLDLPVSLEHERIKTALLANQVIIVAGETGSGKTTQLPKICLEAGRGIRGLIGCTQPRRVAARSVAARISDELARPLGSVVGYQVRFQDHSSDEGYIKLMTDGILLAETQHDHWLSAYDTLIIDEAHERSLNIDFLLGYLKQLLPRRPDLKVIITSATIDTERFAAHFNNAPIIQVSGRSYPVEIRYHPYERKNQRGNQSQEEAILDAVAEIDRYDRLADILIFLSGEREIRETSERLQKQHLPNTEILPLYARLSSQEQDRIFKPQRLRRIILATNVAETSLTVPRIKAVIDPGFARISRYNNRSKVQRLQIEPISQASANQRAGRCGRVSAGLCIRLYAEDDFNLREQYTQPEILRTALASVILRMLALRLGDIEDFPFLEAPEDKAIRAGFRQLQELGAVDEDKQLTELGKQLARLPIDPRLGRMIIASIQHNCLEEVLIICAALSVADARERPLDKQQAADNAHSEFAHPQSDFLGFVKLWQSVHTQKAALGSNPFRRWCQKNFLSFLRIREWQDIYRQLKQLSLDQGWQLNQSAADYPAVHQALLTGLLSQIAFLTEKKHYIGAYNLKAQIFPGSQLFGKNPKWLMAAELVDTGRLYLRCVAKIEPEWVEMAAAKLCRKHYFEPHWQKSRAQIGAYEQVSLYGLILVVKRRINYGAIDPVLAREMFIRHALVYGEYRTRARFFLHNRQLIEDIRALEHKTRRQDILIEDEQLFDYYQKLIPVHIYTGAAFEKWLKQQDEDCLKLKREHLMQQEETQIDKTAYPDQFNYQGMQFPLSYHFEPGHEDDGVCVHIPVSLLKQLRPEPFDWLVPGLRKEKIIALLRSLPKQKRKAFVPIPDFANAAIAALTPNDQALAPQLGQFLHKITGIQIEPSLWDISKLNAHLQMHYEIMDAANKPLAREQDLAALQQQWQAHSQDQFAQMPKQKWEQSGLTDWNFGKWQDNIALQHHGVNLQAYPALIDKKDSVAIELLDDANDAQSQHRQGLYRLFALNAASLLKKLQQQLPLSNKDCLHYAPIGTCQALGQDIIYTVTAQYWLQKPLPETQASFKQRLEDSHKDLSQLSLQFGKIIIDILKHYHQLAKQFKGSIHPSQLYALADIKAHLDQLIYRGFIRDTPPSQLKHLPRYLKAHLQRLEQASLDPQKDRQKAAEFKPWWQKWQDHLKKQPQAANSETGQAFRWMLEEYHVSLFAQALRTPYPVSKKRLQQAWEQCQQQS